MTNASKHIRRRPRPVLALLVIVLSLLPDCNRPQKAVPPDNPRLTPQVTMRNVVFRSAALGRDMPYRVVLPKLVQAGYKLPAVYLLHGSGGDFRDWSNYSDVARYAESGMILVMPEGHSSYYTNAVEPSQDRYEDYVVDDLVRDVETRFPAATGRANRAVVGVSMGGFGAVNLALRHPGLFAFAGGISPALDVPSRPFSIKRPWQWRHYRAIFGPWTGPAQRNHDPFVLARSADPSLAPYLFLSCGEQEGLLSANRQFAALLARRHFRYEFHAVPGGHDWNQWNARLPNVFQSLREHLTGSSAPN
jgi:S-formylglutathione hydrolase FrmB